jgi:hypothetical protein
MREQVARFFAGAGSHLPLGQRRSPKVKLDLAGAYRSLFFGNASAAQRDMVLVDLANFSGFYTVAPEGSDLARHEGRREVFARLYSMVNMTPDEQKAFETEARHQALIDNYEGELN